MIIPNKERWISRPYWKLHPELDPEKEYWKMVNSLEEVGIYSFGKICENPQLQK